MLYLDYCHIQGVLKNVLTLRMTLILRASTFFWENPVCKIYLTLYSNFNQLFFSKVFNAFKNNFDITL